MNESEVNKKLFRLVEDKTFDMPGSVKRKKPARYKRADGMLCKILGFVVVFDRKKLCFDYLSEDELDDYDIE